MLPYVTQEMFLIILILIITNADINWLLILASNYQLYNTCK